MNEKKITEKFFLEILKELNISKKDIYSTKEVCEILSISKRTFYRYTKKHFIFSVILKGKRKVSYDELINFLLRNKTYHRQYSL